MVNKTGEDCKILVSYLCTVHEQTLRKLETRVPSCKGLLEKFAENAAPALYVFFILRSIYSSNTTSICFVKFIFDVFIVIMYHFVICLLQNRGGFDLGAGSLQPGPSQGFSTGLQGNTRGSGRRQRSPGRDDDDVDDSYFDEDDDEEESAPQGGALGSLMLSYGDADEGDGDGDSAEPASSSGGSGGEFSTDEGQASETSRDPTAESSATGADAAPATPERPVSRGHYGTPRPPKDGPPEESPSNDSDNSQSSAPGPASKRAKLSAAA